MDRVRPMAKANVRTIYLYTVCLVSLVVVIISVVTLAGVLTEMALPAPPPVPPAVPAPGESLEQTKARFAEEQRIQQLWDRRRRAIAAARSATALALAGLLYAYHWRQVKREGNTP